MQDNTVQNNQIERKNSDGLIRSSIQFQKKPILSSNSSLLKRNIFQNTAEYENKPKSPFIQLNNNQDKNDYFYTENNQSESHNVEHNFSENRSLHNQRSVYRNRKYLISKGSPLDQDPLISTLNKETLQSSLVKQQGIQNDYDQNKQHSQQNTFNDKNQNSSLFQRNLPYQQNQVDKLSDTQSKQQLLNPLQSNLQQSPYVKYYSQQNLPNNKIQEDQYSKNFAFKYFGKQQHEETNQKIPQFFNINTDIQPLNREQIEIKSDKEQIISSQISRNSIQQITFLVEELQKKIIDKQNIDPDIKNQVTKAIVEFKKTCKNQEIYNQEIDSLVYERKDKPLITNEQLSELYQQINLLETQLEEEEEKRKQQEIKLKEAIEQANQLKQENNSLVQERKDKPPITKQQLSELYQQINQLETQLVEKEEKYNQQEIRLKKLIEQQNQLKQENDSLVYERKNKPLITNEQLSELYQQINQLETQLEEEEEKRKQQEIKLKETIEQATQLKQENDSLVQERKDKPPITKQQLSELYQQINQLETQLVEKEEKYNQQEIKLKKVIEQANQLNENSLRVIRGQSNVNEDLLQQIIYFEQENKQLKSQVVYQQQVQYQAPYQKSENIISALEQQIQEKDSQLEKNSNQFKILQCQIIDLKAKLEESQANKNIQKFFKDLQLKKDDQGFSNKQVQQVLETLNPEIQIQNNLISFTKNFQNITQSQPSHEQKIILQQQNDNLIQQYMVKSQESNQNSQNNKVCNSQNTKEIEAMQCILVLQSLYKQDGITTFITDQSVQTLYQDENNQIQQQYLQSGLHSQLAYFQLQIPENSVIFQQLSESTSKDQFQKFIFNFKNQIGQKIDSSDPQQDVIILNVKYDNTPQIEFKVNSKNLKISQIKEKLNLDSIGVSVNEKSLLEYAKLSVSMFNPEFNMEWPKNSYEGKFGTRGQLKFYTEKAPKKFKYYFPVGYKGYALNIDNYGNDERWISKNADEYTWIPLFHGTNQQAVEGIMNQNLAPGYRNLNGGSICRITGTNIKKNANANVYLTDQITNAEEYADVTSSFGGKKYQIVFQCRVNPKGVKSPETQPSFYAVEDNNNIRPYRVLLKEIS